MYKDEDTGELRPQIGKNGAARVTLVDRDGNPVTGFGSGSGSGGGTVGGALESTQLDVLAETTAQHNFLASLLPTLADGAYDVVTEATYADVYSVTVAHSGLSVGDVVSRRVTQSGAISWYRETTSPGAIAPPNIANLTLIAEGLCAEVTKTRTPAGQMTPVQVWQATYSMLPPYQQLSEIGWQ